MSVLKDILIIITLVSSVIALLKVIRQEKKIKTNKAVTEALQNNHLSTLETKVQILENKSEEEDKTIMSLMTNIDKRLAVMERTCKINHARRK